MEVLLQNSPRGNRSGLFASERRQLIRNLELTSRATRLNGNFGLRARILKYRQNPDFHYCPAAASNGSHDSRVIDTLISDAFALIARAIIEASNSSVILRGFNAARCTGHVTFIKSQARVSQLTSRDLMQSSRQARILVDHRDATTRDNKPHTRTRRCVSRCGLLRREFSRKRRPDKYVKKV